MRDRREQNSIETSIISSLILFYIGRSLGMCCLERGELNDYSFTGTTTLIVYTSHVDW